jgi:AraC-like DNA-binding protein
MVVRGRIRLTVSFECFELNQGDYVVVRERDSHALQALEASSEVVSLYFRMQDYLEKIPYLYSVLFCCESFDLAKYRNETAKIRNLILGVLLRLSQGTDEAVSEALSRAEELLWILVNDYDMVKYYNRKWDVPINRIEKYYAITGYLFEHFARKNPVEYISEREHYSKSYLVHLFKDVGACSLKWALDYVRLFRAEELLLSTNLPIQEISDRCGYSDVKYYTTSFKRWFQTTPSEYRRKIQQDMSQPGDAVRLAPSQCLERINGLVRMDLAEPSYRAAVTPISVRLFGESGGADETPPRIYQDAAGVRVSGLSGWMVPLGCDALDKHPEELAWSLGEIGDRGFLPIILLDRRAMDEASFLRLVKVAARINKVAGRPDWQWLVYCTDQDQESGVRNMLSEGGASGDGPGFFTVIAGPL